MYNTTEWPTGLKSAMTLPGGGLHHPVLLPLFAATQSALDMTRQTLIVQADHSDGPSSAPRK